MRPPRIPLFQVKGTDMYPSTLLVAKLLWLILFFHGTLSIFEVPFLPLLKPLDVLRPQVVPVSLALQSMFFLGGVALLLNVRPRVASAVVGLSILLLLLGNRTTYRNHVFICVCAFLIGAVHRRDERPWMLVWQVAVLYVFSGFNKLFEADWRDGQFFDAWLGSSVAWYQWGAAQFAPKAFGAMMAWGTIVFEITMGAMFLIQRTRAVAVWLAAGFHVGLFVMLDGATFGFFLHNAMVVLLAFVRWDIGSAVLCVPRKISRIARALLPWVDHDGHIIVGDSADGRWLLQVDGVGEMAGWAAIRGTLARLPIVWIGFVGAVLVAPWYLPLGVINAALSAILVTGWIAFFPFKTPGPVRISAAPAAA